MQGESTLLTIHVYYKTCLISVQDNQYALWANVEFCCIKELVNTLLNEPGATSELPSGAEEECLLESINMDCDATVPKVLESPITATDSQILHTADDTVSGSIDTPQSAGDDTVLEGLPLL